MTEQRGAEETPRSEARLEAVLDGALDAVIMMDAEGLVVSWNARAEVLFGLTKDEAVGRKLSLLIIPERYRRAHDEGLVRFLATGEGRIIGRRMELSALRRDGSELPVELTVTVLREGDRVLFNAFVADITERKRTLQRLSAQHLATRILAESSTLAEAGPRMLEAVGAALGWDVGLLWTVDGRAGTMRCHAVWRPSPAAVPKFESLSRTVALQPGIGLAGRVWSSGDAAWIPDISVDPNLPHLAVALSEGLRSAFAFPVRFRGVLVAVVEFFSRERRERDGELIKIMADLESQVAHFWQRRRAEKDLGAAQERLAHVVASSPAVLYSLKVEGAALLLAWVSENIERFAGYGAAEVASRPEWWNERLHPDDRDRVIAGQALLFSAGYIAREFRFRHRSGSYLWVHDEQVLIRDSGGLPVEAVGSWSDVTALKEAELKLEESEEQYRRLFDSNPQPMWVYDDETLAFLAVNEAAVRHYGYSREEFLAMTARDVRPPEEVEVLDELVARRLDRDFDAFASPRVWKHRKKDGTRIDVEISGSTIRFQGRQAFLVLCTDVTDRKRLEEQLVQSQKMETVGRLAGGIAHDFNNLLGVITGYGDLLVRDLGPSHRGLARLQEIRKAADRAAALTRQLLAFSRKQVLEPKVLVLNDVVTNVETMLRRLIGEDVHLITVFGSALARVKADPGQLEQVIVNLALNARDAMPQGGKLIIETRNVSFDAGYVRSVPEARPGPHVMLAVGDTGHGMDAATLSHVFEPFFTTKEEGRGTGLGLAMVHGIVRQSGGHVTVDSEVGRGTTFRIYLPALAADEKDEPVAASRVTEPTPSGTETILLVEDEASLRVMIADILETAGYKVLVGPTPEEALAVAGAHPAAIDLVLTDVVLPRMSGRQMAERLHSSRPETKVLFMSGYTDDAIGHHGVLDADVHFLQKPFTTAALLHKIRTVLGTGPPD